ncbi:hypothetical protein JOC70_000780 [Clostridium pascui]|nr:hypothetical protein [Clostridium pascui]
MGEFIFAWLFYALGLICFLSMVVCAINGPWFKGYTKREACTIYSLIAIFALYMWYALLYFHIYV